jgi:alanine racemase
LSDDIAAAGYVEVRLGSLARNYDLLRDAANEAEIGAVVKADAYGLGAARIAAFLLEKGCRRFFVATLEEGVALRDAVPADTGAEIYVFEGPRTGTERVFRTHSLIPVLNSLSQIEAWLNVGGPSVVHVDTGMSRLGVSAEESASVFSQPGIVERLGLQFLMTHLACADEPNHPHNVRQLERFNEVRAQVDVTRVSIANSAGAFLGERFRGDLIRAGIALYGGNPFAAERNPMRSVASLRARVLQVRELTRTASVGYGATYEAPAGSRIATVGVGYADGYPRILGNQGQAVLNGTRVPVVGRVSMDLTCLDVTGLGPESVSVGDYAEMFGEHVALEEIAGLCSTISYEILTGLGARLPRIYVD